MKHHQSRSGNEADNVANCSRYRPGEPQVRPGSSHGTMGEAIEIGYAARLAQFHRRDMSMTQRGLFWCSDTTRLDERKASNDNQKCALVNP